MTIAESFERMDEDLPDATLAKEFYMNYEMKEILGRGVSSTVRRCTDKRSDEEYAVKIIDLTGEKGLEYQAEELVSCTKKEVNILRMCAQHPFIIELHDTFETSTFMFLVFEICRKGELFDYLTEVVTLSEKRTRQIMKQLLEAVNFIHEKNIVHRDLKPENILLDGKMNVKLSDFGFASVISHDKELQDLCGTPGYLAPEVLRSSMYDDAEGYGKPVDMWACGVIMYTLLVGCPPFWHRRQMMMLRAIMEGKYSFNSPEWQDVSEPPKDLISKLLVVDPLQRYTAAEALNHPFFIREEVSDPVYTHACTVTSKLDQSEEAKYFNPRRMFKAAIIAVRMVHRIRTLHYNPPPVSLDNVRKDPYSSRIFRKIIDSGAFKIYGHWVKRGENQNRAALFENAPKRDLKVADLNTSSLTATESSLKGPGQYPSSGNLRTLHEEPGEGPQILLREPTIIAQSNRSNWS